MSNNPLRLRRLFEKYVQGTCTSEQLREMWTLMQDHADNDTLDEDMKTWWDNEVEVHDLSTEVNSTKIFEEILRKEKKLRSSLNRWRANRQISWWKWTAVASLILICGSAYFFLRHAQEQKAILSATAITDVQAPQVNRAVIKLANGQLVYLDSTQAGRLAVQGNVKIEKVEDGKINYSNLESKDRLASSETEYNTLTNPRGSRVIAVTLSDGSRVWLNAGSSLTYPVAFNSSERNVTMSGEAYFEVKHDSRRPFRVKVGNEVIEDLGTSFNVSAYTDEPALRTTLLDGSIKLSLTNKNSASPVGGEFVLLKPGEQAMLNRSSFGLPKIEVEQLDDVEDVIAWKSDQFRFNSVDIASVMRQAARWYDVDIEYKGYVKGTISGGAARSKNISELLKILELTGKVHFTLEGRKVIVYAVNDTH